MLTYLSRLSGYNANGAELGKHQHSLPLRTHPNNRVTESSHGVESRRSRDVYQSNPGALDILAASDHLWKSDEISKALLRWKGSF